MSTIKLTNCFQTIGTGVAEFRRWSPLVWLVAFWFCLNFLVPRAAAQSNTAAAYTFTTLAGSASVAGTDGLGPNARFNNPLGVAIAASGNIYVADTSDFVVRKITPAGVVSTIAGRAGDRNYIDGLGSAARFWVINGITADTHGNLYVTDNYDYIIRKLTPTGTNWMVSTIAGKWGLSGTVDSDDVSFGPRFYNPQGIAADSTGNIYVADGAVRKLVLNGTNWVVSTVANSVGYTLVRLVDPTLHYVTNVVALLPAYATGIATDVGGSLYVTDYTNHTVFELDPVGTNWNVRLIAGASGISGTTDGVGTNARFLHPAGIAVDGLGILSVTDGNQTIRRLTRSGTNWLVSTLAGSAGNSGGAEGVGTNALFNLPVGVAADAANNLIVADSHNNEIRKITSAGVVHTIAGTTNTSQGSVDGIGTGARFNSPGGTAVDGAGNVYVSDSGNNTIRMITPVGIVSTLAGLAGNAGTNDGIGSNARFNYPDGIAVDTAGNLYVAQPYAGAVRWITPAGVVSTIPGVTATDIAAGAADQIFIVSGSIVQQITRSGTNWSVNTIATLPSAAACLAASSDGRLFIVADYNQLQMLTPVGTNWVLSNVASLPVFPYHIAADAADNIYIAGTSDNSVLKAAKAGTNWTVSTIGGSQSTTLFMLGGYADGAGSAAQFGIPYGMAVDRAGTVYVSDAVNNNIRVGVSTPYTPSQPVAYTPSPMNAALQVTLVPPEANGQWRFPWEFGWHNSGYTLSNLVAGNYEIEFRNLPGWLAIPIQPVQVTGGGTTIITNVYYPTISAGDPNSTPGALTVFLGPTPPVGAGWRFLGGNGPFFNSGYATNLLPGTYLVEFAPVSGRITPQSQTVLVNPGLPSFLSVNYLLAATPPANVYLPFPVPTNQINDETTYPFGFNGQLQSDNGYGSGVAVAANVVLTAAHLVFNDQTLSYVRHAHWFFRRNAGVSEPLPQAARGWYVLSGYAAQRTNDLQSGYSPDQSTPPSRNADVAALYFPLPVAGGGYGGYLPSDTVPNSWLTGNSLKMLTGYPVDGSQFGNAGIVPGTMYQTEPQTYPLAMAADPVPGQQEVYVAPWFLSYPGNSGGPLYVQFNGYYYPAAVYLGTLFSGSQPYASVVRAIDSSVVNMITLAQTLGDSGTNNTGGGVITIIPSQDINVSHPGYVQFQLAPPAAVQAGAGWRLQGDASYSSTTNYTRAVTSTNAFAVEFKPVPGWNLPTNQSVIVVSGVLLTNLAFYTVTNPLMQLNPVLGLGITGTTGTSYRIEYRTNLLVGQWLPLKTNTLASGLNILLPWPPTNGPAAFYRAVWLP